MPKIYPVIIFGLILLDAVSKLWSENLEAPTVLLSNILSLQYAQNTGIAFSIPLTGMLLKIVTVILIFCIFFYYYKEERQKKSKLLDLGYILVIAGSLGNAWERIFRGYVTDFIAVEHFAIFNLADSYISIGALCVIAYNVFLTDYQKEK